MSHLFKVPLEFADLFIKSIDLKENKIEIQTREKETGKSLTPLRWEKFQLLPDHCIHFAGGKLHIKMVEEIHKILTA